MRPRRCARDPSGFGPRGSGSTRGFYRKTRSEGDKPRKGKQAGHVANTCQKKRRLKSSGCPREGISPKATTVVEATSKPVQRGSDRRRGREKEGGRRHAQMRKGTHLDRRKWEAARPERRQGYIFVQRLNPKSSRAQGKGKRRKIGEPEKRQHHVTVRALTKGGKKGESHQKQFRRNGWVKNRLIGEGRLEQRGGEAQHACETISIYRDCILRRGRALFSQYAEIPGPVRHRRRPYLNRAPKIGECFQQR